MEQIPIHPEYGVQDWDSAEGAIDWPRMINALREVRSYPAPRDLLPTVLKLHRVDQTNWSNSARAL